MKKGFTLIELIVVISIISLLTSVVISALGDAKNKSSNAAVKSGLLNALKEAELYRNNNGTYMGVCGDTNFKLIVSTATTTGGGGACYQSPTSWTVVSAIKLPENGKNAWCVGSSVSTTTFKGISSFNPLTFSTDCI